MPRADDPPDVQVVVARLESMHDTMLQVLAEQHKTNGRVTALETEATVAKALAAQAARAAAIHRAARSWVPGTMTTLAAVVLGYLLAHFVG